MAKPIITTDVPDCRDAVEHGVNGLLCKLKDTNDVAFQMEKIFLFDENQRMAMGKKGREKIVSEFDESIVIDRYKDAIKQIIT